MRALGRRLVIAMVAVLAFGGLFFWKAVFEALLRKVGWL